MKYLVMLVSVGFMSSSYAQESPLGESVASPSLSQKPYSIQASFESYTPRERDSFTFQGVNVGFEWNSKFTNSKFVMVMGPNISVLNEEKSKVEEDIVFVKWNHGFLYNIDLGGNMLLKPQISAGLGYGWLNSDRPGGLSQTDENAPLVELIGGLEFSPFTDMNVYAKGGYRYFEIDDVGDENTGQLEGEFAMLGLGVNF